MGNCSALLSPVEPWTFYYASPLKGLLAQLDVCLAGEKHVWRVVLDGRAMRSRDDFYEEFARQFRVPYRLGHNLNALRDCLTDLGWLDRTIRVFILVIRDSHLVLEHEQAEGLRGALDALQYAGAEWAKPIAQGQAWDRPALPFHTILQSDKSGLERFRDIGYSLSCLDI